MNADDDTQALTVTQPAELSLGHPIPSVVARFEYLREVLAKVMREGSDFGTIPGLGDRPSLFKSGAEKLCTAFGLAPRLAIDRRDLDGGHREYEVRCTLVHIATGAVVAEGVGSCSTMESRYRWRKGERTCPDCGQAAIIKGKAEYGGGWVCFGKKGGCGAKWQDGAREIEGQTVGRVENPDIADTYNVVLKIAKKRAQVDATLTAAGASDLLTQDLEDLSHDEREPPARPEPARREPARREPRTSERRSAPAQEPTVEPGEDWVIDLVGRIDECETAEALRKLAPKINAMPKGSAGRRMCRKAYDERLAQLSQPE